MWIIIGKGKKSRKNKKYFIIYPQRNSQKRNIPFDSLSERLIHNELFYFHDGVSDLAVVFNKVGYFIAAVNDCRMVSSAEELPYFGKAYINKLSR